MLVCLSVRPYDEPVTCNLRLRPKTARISRHQKKWWQTMLLNMKTFASCEGPVGSGITVKHFKHSSVAFSRWPTSSCRRRVGACVCTRWTHLKSALLPTSCRRFHIQLSQLALGPLVWTDGRLVEPVARSDTHPCLEYQRVAAVRSFFFLIWT